MDVAIFGAGPAGASAAIALARAGATVAVFTRPANSAFLVGETLSPSAGALLARLNANVYFDRCPKIDSMGILSCWGSADLGIQDFIFQPGGRGWHVDREALNRALIDAARDAGVQVKCLTSAPQLTRAETGEWLTPAGPARFLVDATGRSSSLCFPGSPSHQVADATVSVARHWRSACGESAFDGWALIESCEQGWCYTAPLPGQKIVTSFQADPNWSRTASADWNATWNMLLANLPETARRFRGAQPLSSWRVFSAASKTRSAFAGPGWIVAGDAANACDPLSGSGVTRALSDGLRAAHVVDRTLTGDTASAVNYREQQSAEWTAYLSARRWYYSLESRWKEAPFWTRRSLPAEDTTRSGEFSSKPIAQAELH